MTAYYNEFDPKAAAWLRELIAEGVIANGEVDETDIRDVDPGRLDRFTQCHFFAGIGGWSYALRLAGWPDDRPVWTGSCPCQPFSVAGKGEGLDDPRHLWPAFRWLITHHRPATSFGEQVASNDGREWLSGVRLDLEAMGYAVGGADLCSAGVGSANIRQRLWWVGLLADTDCPQADSPKSRQSVPCKGRVSGRMGITNSTGSQQRKQAGEAVGHRNTAFPAGDNGGMANTKRNGRKQGTENLRRRESEPPIRSQNDDMWWPCSDGKSRRIPARAYQLQGVARSGSKTDECGQIIQVPEPSLFPLANGVSPQRVGILRGAGNAINPWVASEFIKAAIHFIPTEQSD